MNNLGPGISEKEYFWERIACVSSNMKLATNDKKPYHW